ncbi:MAG TPA: hypothetical protein VFG47_19665 [Geminicoccaceae bacterium]|jgi:hypothetical protein|nr:hypothetical protein [Geminicoccaceae bacterium]
MTVEQLRARLCALHARIGREGRLALTIDDDPAGTCYASHWFRPGRHAPEDWRQVAVGGLSECLRALDRYAEGYRREQAERYGGAPGFSAEAERIAAE